VRVAPAIRVTYYRFVGQEQWPAGTRLRVSSGGPPPADASDPSDGIVRRYAGSPGISGRLHFGADEVRLRLISSDGRPTHERSFLPDGNFAALEPVHVLRSADRTALALFACPSLNDGPNRLSFTFRRYNRAIDPPSPVLSQAGRTESELVTLDIPWDTR
jgi:hypothetical protein